MLLQNTSGAYIRSEIHGFEQFKQQIAKHRPLAVIRICLWLNALRYMLEPFLRIELISNATMAMR